MPKLKKRLILAILIITGLIAWLGSSAFVAWRFTRRSSAPFLEPTPNVNWATIEGHRLKTSDGQELGAWLVRGKPNNASVLLLHGNSTSRGSMLQVMEWLAKADFTVMAISLRAHGDSTGDVNDLGWSARHDVKAAVEFLEQTCAQRPIYIVGRSLGAAAAVFAAQDMQKHVSGYFLEQPYKDLDSAVWNRLENHLLPGLDLIAYCGLRLWGPLFLPVKLSELTVYDHIQDIPKSTPIVIITGSADRHARLDDVKALFARVESHAQLVIFDGAEHVALDNYNPELYQETLLKLLDDK
jgi:uncharacterized protein